MKYLVPFFCLFTFSLFSQDSIQVVNDFKFKDGIYLDINDLKNNTPSYSWAELNASAHLNRE